MLLRQFNQNSKIVRDDFDFDCICRQILLIKSGCLYTKIIM